MKPVIISYIAVTLGAGPFSSRFSERVFTHASVSESVLLEKSLGCQCPFTSFKEATHGLAASVVASERSAVTLTVVHLISFFLFRVMYFIYF